MKNKLTQIYKFLYENRHYNIELQKAYLRIALDGKTNPADKIISLFYNISNTQSQPKIDKLAKFFMEVYEDITLLESFEGLIYYLDRQKVSDTPYLQIFNALKDKDGWGKKTASLFVKNIFNCHINPDYNEFKIWDDTPAVSQKDKLYLPVDAVIISIFEKIDKQTSWNFQKINKILDESSFSQEEILQFDDLWFWGFITQHGTGANRKLVWNENKYWILKESNKDKESIEAIKNKATQFLNLITDS